MELMAKVTLIYLAAVAACVLLQPGSAALRHAVWVAAGVAVLSVAVIPSPVRHSVEIAVAAPGPVSVETVVDVEPERDSIPWLSLLWVCGSAAIAGRFVYGSARVAGLTRRAASFGVEDGVPVRVSGEVTIPFTWGLLRPVIVLPEAAATWPGERRRLVLQHERVHVRRRDWLAQTISQMACAVYWFHPLAWYAARQMRLERERACDDELLRSGVNAVDYAGHLLELTRGAAGRTVAGVAMAEQNELEARMRFLLDLKRNRKALGRAGAIGVVSAALVLVAPLALVKVRAQGGGGLRGVVQDPSGGRVPEATVLLKKGTAQEVAYSGADGAFLFGSVPAGEYTMQVLRGASRVGRSR